MRCSIYFIQLSFLGPLFFQVIFAARKIYSDTWAVNIDGDEDYAKNLAKKHNYEYIGQVCITML